VVLWGLPWGLAQQGRQQGPRMQAQHPGVLAQMLLPPYGQLQAPPEVELPQQRHPGEQATGRAIPLAQIKANSFSLRSC
jgi:hypothetical protein